MKEDEWKAIAFYSSFIRAIYWKISQKAKISALRDVNLTEKKNNRIFYILPLLVFG